LQRFKKEIRYAFKQRDKRHGTNITKLQENEQHHEYIILLIDKNLSSCVMNRSDYIEQVLK